MMKSTRRKKSDKPRKPHPDFPLFPHATKRWAQKIRGRMHYSGPGDDPDGALKKSLDQKDDLLAGRTPLPAGAGLTLLELSNRFLTSKKNQLTAGELTSRTWADYYRACETMLDFFGKDR